jgi:Family of unknown function (DUF5681)
MSGGGSAQDSKVGYKRPPIQTRFQKGQSGNPRGRQRGVRNFALDVKRSLEIPVTLNDKGRPRRVSTQEALMLIIVDDPLNATDAYSEPARKRVIDWYGGTLVSRLNDKKTGSIIGVMQRLHEEDLAGHLIEQGGWHCLELPAIALDDEVIPLGRGLTHRRCAGDVLHPERESRTALEAIRTEIGSQLFSAQYQQRPTPPGGAMIKRTWVRRYTEPPRREDVLQIIQSWDTARADRLTIGRSARRGRRPTTDGCFLSMSGGTASIIQL